MLIWQRMTGTVGWWASRQLGQFSFGIQCLYWFRSLPTLRFWWTSKNHKHANKTKHTRNETWACVIIQSVSTKKRSSIHFVKIRLRHTWMWYSSDFFFDLLHEKELWILFFLGKQKPAGQCTYQHKVHTHKYKWWHWLHCKASRWTPPSNNLKKKHFKRLCGNIWTVLDFQPFAHPG